MAASYIEPLERAWARVRGLLFRPFDVERWVVIGFAAFLAGLAGGGWTNVSFTLGPPGWRLGLPPRLVGAIVRPFERTLDLAGDPLRLLFSAPLLLGAAALALALLWVSSRAKFVLLDDLLTGRPAIADPWRRFAAAGNSLFLWRVGFVLVALIAFSLAVSPLALAGRALPDAVLVRPLAALSASVAGLLALAIGTIVACVACLLDSFIVPLMYARDRTATEAWRSLLPLLRKAPVDFLLYALAVLLGALAVGVAYLAVTVVTCCVAPLLLAIPYVGTVLLLPLHGLYRLYGVEFLSQFGPDYTVGPRDEPAPAPPGPPDPGPEEPTAARS